MSIISSCSLYNRYKQKVSLSSIRFINEIPKNVDDFKKNEGEDPKNVDSKKNKGEEKLSKQEDQEEEKSVSNIQGEENKKESKS